MADDWITRAVRRDQRRRAAELAEAAESGRAAADDPAPVYCDGCDRCHGEPRSYVCSGMDCYCSVH